MITNMPTAMAPSHPVSNRRFINISHTIMLRITANRFGRRIMNSVDNTVPSNAIVKASDSNARFLPTTINPARYSTTASTKSSITNRTRAKSSVKPSRIPHRQSGLALANNNCVNIAINWCRIISNHLMFCMFAVEK